jgi:menaquinone-dependent protoporphyrinogen oxidase
MPNALIVYATTDGQTRKISERIQQTLRDNGLEATLVDVEKAAGLDPAGFDGVIAGASVRYGKHDPEMAGFLEGNRDAIDRVPNAFFSVNLIARKPEKRNLEGNKYLRKFLERLSFSPMHVEIIAGKLDYPSYRFIDRVMIQMIMKITGGPTDGKSVIEYTDWDQVDRFAARMAEAIVSSDPSARASDNSTGNQGTT